MEEAPQTPPSRPVLLFVHASAELYGSDKVLFNVARDCAARGIFQPVVVLAEQGPLQAELCRAGIEVHQAEVAKIRRSMLTWRAPVTLWRALAQARSELQRIVAGREVALVYSNTLAVLGGAFHARRIGCPHLWHVHETPGRPRLVGYGLVQLVDRLADRVVANSSPTREWLLRQAPRLKARCEVVHNGIAPLPPVTPAQVADFRARVQAGPDDIVVACVGRFNHLKGQALLVDAVAALHREGRAGQLRVALVGDVYAGHEDFRESLASRIAAHGLQDRVFLLPFERDIHRVWRASDLAAVPSLEPEGFGLVAVEAMACGLPVIAAGHGGVLDIIEHGHSGWLFPPGSTAALAQALDRLAQDAALRRQIGALAAVRQAERFSLQGQLAHLHRLCEQSACPA
jgi:glycosyltransferase involved in cell wall biosynthesis